MTQWSLPIKILVTTMLQLWEMLGEVIVRSIKEHFNPALKIMWVGRGAETRGGWYIPKKIWLHPPNNLTTFCIWALDDLWTFFLSLRNFGHKNSSSFGENLFLIFLLVFTWFRRLKLFKFRLRPFFIFFIFGFTWFRGEKLFYFRWRPLFLVFTWFKK